MKFQRKITYIFFIFLLFSTSAYSQNQLNKFRDKIDIYMLSSFISRSVDDTIFVSNSKQYDSGDNNLSSFYYYNSRTKKKIFSYGYTIAYPFVGKSALVKYNGRWGIIDKNGKFIFYSDSYGVKLSSYEKYVILEDGMYDLLSGTPKENAIYCAEPATPDYFVLKAKNGKYNLNNEKNEPIFKTEVDSIIKQQDLLYKGNSIRNLLIVKKKNKYGLRNTDGHEILKIKYENAKFVGNYFMLFENNTWNYYVYENNKLNLILSTPFECITPAYQVGVIGAFKKDNKYNLLKVNGEILLESFDYINDDATFGIKENTLVIFDSKVNYYTYFER
ncbi:hypothetical protein [Chryseobacterium sp. MMS23-Vi53]|uniref:hypothetical protein n=1 Tax=Chryseobacterium sp. MMS23-Vi53 TaxID=3386644 RepID=UPI0039EA408B